MAHMQKNHPIAKVQARQIAVMHASLFAAHVDPLIPQPLQTIHTAVVENTPFRQTLENAAGCLVDDRKIVKSVDYYLLNKYDVGNLLLTSPPHAYNASGRLVNDTKKGVFDKLSKTDMPAAVMIDAILGSRPRLAEDMRDTAAEKRLETITFATSFPADKRMRMQAVNAVRLFYKKDFRRRLPITYQQRLGEYYTNVYNATNDPGLTLQFAHDNFDVLTPPAEPLEERGSYKRPQTVSDLADCIRSAGILRSGGKSELYKGIADQLLSYGGRREAKLSNTGLRPDKKHA